MAEDAVVTERLGPRFRTGLAPRWRWLVWGLFACAWTVALLSTFPLQVRDAVVEDDTFRFSTGKVLHVTAYAFFAILTSWLRLSLNVRRGLLLFLILHAAAMEYLQQFVARGASWSDVGLNLLGVTLGVACTWKRWFAKAETPPP